MEKCPPWANVKMFFLYVIFYYRVVQNIVAPSRAENKQNSKRKDNV